jgi:UDP-N-acetyl-D-galactosamine dehydrogenase
VAAAFAKHYPVIGYDINSKRIEELLKGYDRNHEVPSDALQNPNLTFTADLEKLREANFFIVTVPTPIDIYKVPDLTPLRKASEALAQILKKGDTVVYESTVYPGCTEEVCIPILEQSGLRRGRTSGWAIHLSGSIPGILSIPLRKSLRSSLDSIQRP